MAVINHLLWNFEPDLGMIIYLTDCSSNVDALECDLDLNRCSCSTDNRSKFFGEPELPNKKEFQSLVEKLTPEEEELLKEFCFKETLDYRTMEEYMHPRKGIFYFCLDSLNHLLMILNRIYICIYLYIFDSILFVELYCFFNTSFNDYDLVHLWLGVVMVGIVTILARGVGPRSRPDQLSDLTWKDIIIILVSTLIVIMALV